MLPGLADGTVDVDRHRPRAAPRRRKARRVRSGAVRHRRSRNGRLAGARPARPRRRHQLARLVELLSVNPARILRVPGGTLEPGAPADLTILAPDVDDHRRARPIPLDVAEHAVRRLDLEGSGRGDDRRRAPDLRGPGPGRRRAMRGSEGRSGRRDRQRAADVGRLKPALDRLYREDNCADRVADPIEIARRYTDPATARSSASAPPASRSGAWRACCSRSSGCWRSWVALPGGVSSRDFDPRRDGTRASTDRVTGGRAAAISSRCLGAAADDRLRRFDRRLLPRGRRRRSRRTSDAALEHFPPRAALDLGAVYGRRAAPAGRRVLLSQRPSSGSACKRLNLFLRWMVRSDALDFGVWSGVSPAQLIVPLDTHVIRARPVPAPHRPVPRPAGGWPRHHGVAAPARPGGSGQVRLRAVPPGDDGRVRVQASVPGLRAVRCAGSAGHARVDGERLGDHPLDGEFGPDARQAGRAQALAQVGVVQQPYDRVGHRACDRAAARAGRSPRPRRPRECRRPRVATIGRAHGHRVEQRRAETLGDRAHHEEIEALEQREHVGAEAGQQHVLLEVVLACTWRLERARAARLRRGSRSARPGPAGRRGAAASIRCFCPLCGTSAATLPTTGAWCGSQNSSWTFSGRRRLHAIDVDALRGR